MTADAFPHDPTATVSSLNPVLSVKEAATRVGLSASTLNKMRIYGGGPRFIKLRRRVVYDEADLQQWLLSHRRHSTSDVGVA